MNSLHITGTRARCDVAYRISACAPGTTESQYSNPWAAARYGRAPRREAQARASRAGTSRRTARPRPRSHRRPPRPAARRRGVGHRNRSGWRKTRIRARRIEVGGPVPVRTEDGDAIGRELRHQRLQGSLDPADPRREVVRDQEGARDVHRADILPEAMGSAGHARTEIARARRTRRGACVRRPSGWRKVRVDGRGRRRVAPRPGDVPTWPPSSPGRLRRSLLLTPTGRIRADFTVGRDDEGFLLLQAARPARARRGCLLATLRACRPTSSLARRHRRAVAVRRARRRPRNSWRAFGLSPSVLGPGIDVVLDPTGRRPWRVETASPTHDLVEVGHAALEAWRIRRGHPADGHGLRPKARCRPRPGLDATIDVTKGCFLGQESVAQVRNLGHPPRVLRHVRTEAIVGRGTDGSGRRRRGRSASSRAPPRPQTAEPSRSSGSGGRSATADLAHAGRVLAPRSPSPLDRTSPFGSFPVPRPGVLGLPAFDPFRWAPRLCYESVPATRLAVAGRSRGRERQ